MRLKIDVKDLKEITNLLLTLVNEAKFEFTPNGLSVKAVDPSHVAMIVMDVEKDGFVEYECEEEELGVDLAKVRDILKLTSSNDVVEISKEGGKLTFLIGNLSRSMPLIDTSNLSVPKVPNIGLPAKVVISKSDFISGIKAADGISDSITIKVTPTEFEMYAMGDEDTSRLNLPKDMVQEIDCEEPVKSTYPVDYLLRLAKAMDSAKDITIYLGKDYPVKIVFDVVKGHGKVTYLLAPRIEGD
ncbi:MAG: proliferating cell nuclear antigen (pcna) [Euryarchaeota archaeon]|nr:proliferating cell nuclear antigen (pcna) [Euryarchaeota archaeon]